MGRNVPTEADFFFTRHVTFDDEFLDSIAQTHQAEEPTRQLYDISDYVDACTGRSGITGIQRVQESIVRELLELPGEPVFVIVDARYGRAWALERGGVAMLVQPGARRNIDEQGQLADILRDNARLQVVSPNDLLINLGCFWAERYEGSFERQLQSTRCRYVPLIYDLIPVDHPELCEEKTARRFMQALPSTLRGASAVITISQFTKSRLQAFCADSSLSVPAIHILQLAHQLNRRPERVSVGSPNLLEPGARFVLCVGTIEPRKNQLLLAEAWAMLESDIIRMPTLVFVGKLGWLGSSALERLKDLCRSSSAIIWVHNVSDLQLTWLYENCLFTVFPSVDEGWGLPVGESLAFGKVCLASNAGAISEVGGAFAVYVNPLDSSEIIRQLRSLIVNDQRRKTLEHNIARNFRPRIWSQVAADLRTIAAKLSIWERVAGRPLN